MFLTGSTQILATRGDFFAIFFGKMMKVKLVSKSMLMMRWFLSLDMVLHEFTLGGSMVTNPVKLKISRV